MVKKFLITGGAGFIGSAVVSDLITFVQDRPGIVAVQPKLLYPDGRIQCIGVVFSAKGLLGYPIYVGMPPEHPCINRSSNFQSVTGACMALRSSGFDELQGIDPVYINGQEDIVQNLCLKQRHGRLTGWAATESTVIHHEGKTSSRYQHVGSNRKTYVHHLKNQVKKGDLDYYPADGFSFSGYQSDSPNTLPAVLQVFRPQLTCMASHRHARSADFSRSARAMRL